MTDHAEPMTLALDEYYAARHSNDKARLAEAEAAIEREAIAKDRAALAEKVKEIADRYVSRLLDEDEVLALLKEP